MCPDQIPPAHERYDLVIARPRRAKSHRAQAPAPAPSSGSRARPFSSMRLFHGTPRSRNASGRYATEPRSLVIASKREPSPRWGLRKRHPQTIITLFPTRGQKGFPRGKQSCHTFRAASTGVWETGGTSVIASFDWILGLKCRMYWT